MGANDSTKEYSSDIAKNPPQKIKIFFWTIEMIGIFDTPSEIITAIMIFIIGLIVAILQKGMFGISRRLSVTLYVFHSIFCLYYLKYSVTHPSDSPYYYIMSLSNSGSSYFGTYGIVFITSFFSRILGISYGGTFLFYNIIGFLGVVAFAAALKEVVNEKGGIYWKLCVLILFLPGVHFWSSAIGKDGLAFLSAGLLCWSFLNARKRFFFAAFAILLFFIARPHVALIALAAFGFAFILFGNVRVQARMLLALSLIPIAAASITLTLQNVGLDDVSSVADVTDYIETRQGYNLEGGGGIDISSMSIPMRAFSYLYRPILFETSGILGLAAGIENVLLLIISVYFLYCMMKTKSSLPIFSRCAMLLFFIVSLAVLSNTTANLGIAIRQKWMFMPMIICVGMSYASNMTKKNVRGMIKLRSRHLAS